jgi:hypothetical protein
MMDHDIAELVKEFRIPVSEAEMTHWMHLPTPPTDNEKQP